LSRSFVHLFFLVSIPTFLYLHVAPGQAGGGNFKIETRNLKLKERQTFAYKPRDGLLCLAAAISWLSFRCHPLSLISPDLIAIFLNCPFCIPLSPQFGSSHLISFHFIPSHHVSSRRGSSQLLSSSPLFSVDHNCSHLTSCPLIFFIFSDLFFVQLFSPPSFHAVRLNLVFFLPSAGTQTPKPGLGAKAGNTILNFKDTKLTRKWTTPKTKKYQKTVKN
jgi:hypothetical protein